MGVAHTFYVMDASGKAPSKVRVEEACRSIGGRLINGADVDMVRPSPCPRCPRASANLGRYFCCHCQRMPTFSPLCSCQATTPSLTPPEEDQHAFSFVFLKRKGGLAGSHGSPDGLAASHVGSATATHQISYQGGSL